MISRVTALVRHRLWLVALVFTTITAGCLGGGSSDGGSGGGPGPDPTNNAPTISGTPGTFLQVNENYNFQPEASDADDDVLTFGIENRPEWAEFDASTGRLYGRPTTADVGTYSGIVVSVSDGSASDSITTFSISVDPLATGSVTLSWNPPTTNADGSAITGLAGYRIYYGSSRDDLDEIVVIENVGTVRWVIDNLSPATWYFTMTAFSESGLESARTPVGSKTIT